MSYSTTGSVQLKEIQYKYQLNSDSILLSIDSFHFLQVLNETHDHRHKLLVTIAKNIKQWFIKVINNNQQSQIERKTNQKRLQFVDIEKEDTVNSLLVYSFSPKSVSPQRLSVSGLRGTKFKSVNNFLAQQRPLFWKPAHFEFWSCGSV